VAGSSLFNRVKVKTVEVLENTFMEDWHSRRVDEVVGVKRVKVVIGELSFKVFDYKLS
jgi:hypothetical protein